MWDVAILLIFNHYRQILRNARRVKLHYKFKNLKSTALLHINEKAAIAIHNIVNSYIIV